jgi:hypothetical protein
MHDISRISLDVSTDNRIYITRYRRYSSSSCYCRKPRIISKETKILVHNLVFLDFYSYICSIKGCGKTFCGKTKP